MKKRRKAVRVIMPAECRAFGGVFPAAFTGILPRLIKSLCRESLCLSI
jgi:hypothetical protein